MELTSLIDAYCQVWSDPDEAERAERLQRVWSPSATYTDPMVHVEGPTDLLAHIAKVAAHWPGSRILRTSDVDQHHGVARFAWRIVDAGGNALLEGIDIAFISADGTKIERIVGFFGTVKPMA